jgi:hypothetical protein
LQQSEQTLAVVATFEMRYAADAIVLLKLTPRKLKQG